MNMKIDQHVISWPCFSEYEIVTAPNGKRYIRPTEKSTSYRFHYRVEREQRVIDAVNVGMLVLGKKSETVIETAVLDFVSKHGLLGLMTALKEYAEPYDWVVDQFKDWAYMVSSCYFFYKDGLVTDLKLRISMQEGMEAYGGVAPSHIILLREKPTLWWHFHSLHQCIHLTLSFMLADENNPLRMCKYCKKIYLAGTTEDEWFCSEKCKNAYEKNGDQ